MLVIESFELGVLDRLRAAEVQAAFVFLAERFGSPADEPVGEAPPRSYAWYRSDAGLDLLAGRVDGISVAKANLLRVGVLGQALGPTNLVERAHARGLRVFTWTLRPENRFLNRAFRSHAQRTVEEPEATAQWGDWLAEFSMIASSGVDGVFVDHPDLGVAMRDGAVA